MVTVQQHILRHKHKRDGTKSNDGHQSISDTETKQLDLEKYINNKYVNEIIYHYTCCSQSFQTMSASRLLDVNEGCLASLKF